MVNNVEILLISIVGIVAVITFVVSLFTRHKQQQQEKWQELKRQAEKSVQNSVVADEIIAIRKLSSQNPLAKETLFDKSERIPINNSNIKGFTHKNKPKINKNSDVEWQYHRNQNEQTITVCDTSEHLSSKEADTHSESLVEDETNSNPQNYAGTASQAHSDLVVIYLVAPATLSFQGYDLLQSLLSVGFRFGDMAIFHRFQKANGEGKKLFSLASATEPGTFDIQNMGAFSCKGLCLFMQLTGSEHNEHALDLMLQTAETLAEDLNAQLLGSDRKPLTEATISHYRKWVKQHQEDFSEEHLLSE